MSRRPLFGRPMTAVERQQRRRLKLAGGPAPRLKREVQRALEAGLLPAEAAQALAPILGGTGVPAEATSPLLGHQKRDVPVTDEAKALVARFKALNELDQARFITHPAIRRATQTTRGSPVPKSEADWRAIWQAFLADETVKQELQAAAAKPARARRLLQRKVALSEDVRRRFGGTARKCAACGEVVTREYVTVDRKDYHPECLAKPAVAKPARGRRPSHRKPAVTKPVTKRRC